MNRDTAEPVQQSLINFYQQWHDFTYTGLVLIGTLVVASILRFLLHRFRQPMDAVEQAWRHALLGAINAPVRCLVWVIGLSIAESSLVSDNRLPIVADVFPPLRDVIIIGLFAWFLIRLISGVTESLYLQAKKEHRHFDHTAADAVNKALTAAIVIIGALFIMQILGFSLASLLTFGGVAGIALGFAAQGLVSNLLGGITIYASKPFKVGDHVVFPGSSLKGSAAYIGWQAGEVEHIGWRATRIRDWNGKPFYVPNAKFNTETIINHSRMAYREIAEYIHVRLEDVDKVADIVSDVNRMLERHPKMGSYYVFQLESFGEYSIRLYLYAYTISMIRDYPDYLPVKQDVLLKIADIIHKHDAKLAVPVSTVYLPGNQSTEYRQQPGPPPEPEPPAASADES